MCKFGFLGLNLFLGSGEYLHLAFTTLRRVCSAYTFYTYMIGSKPPRACDEGLFSLV